MARMVAAASEEGIFHGKCLERSIVLWWFLQRRGFPASCKSVGAATGAGFERRTPGWKFAGAVINDHDGVGQEFSPFGGNAASVGIDSR